MHGRMIHNQGAGGATHGEELTEQRERTKITKSVFVLILFVKWEKVIRLCLLNF
jgi:hypothetical protein